jgi:hypothetical protein
MGAHAQTATQASAAPECFSNDSARRTKQEEFVLQRVKQGQVANFEIEKEYGDAMNPCRILRAKFLEDLLLDGTYRDQITRHGVLITGARFTERVDLENADLKYEFWAANSIFEKGASLSGLRSTHLISFYGAKVIGFFNLSGIQAGGDLLISNNANLDDVDLGGGARIRGDLYLNELTVNKTLSMEGIRVEGDLNMDKGHFNDLNMTRARIGGVFLLRGLTGPRSAILSDLVFSSANLGADPITALKNLMTAANRQGFSPQNYSKLAKSYSDSGQTDVARDILIEMRNSEYRHADTILTKCYLFVWWLAAAYGYRPEVGFVWILVFVTIGWAIFRKAAPGVVTPRVPDSWFFFALDSVIPGINLKKDHEEIAFRDWRKYVLYFLRFLGAIVVFIVLELLKRNVVESG